MPVTRADETRAAVGSPSLGLVAHVAVVLQGRIGLDAVMDLVDEVGVPNPFRADLDTRIPLHQEAAFVEAACEAAGDIDFAFTAGLALHHATTLPGYLSERSKTLRDALIDACRFLPLVRPGMDFELRERGNIAGLRLDISDPALREYPRHTEVVYAGVMGQIRSFTARPFHPEELSFRHDRVPVSGEVRSELGCPVVFDAEVDEMLLDPRVLERHIRGRDDALRALLVDHGEMLESHARRVGHSFAERVELFIQKALHDDAPDVETAARSLGVSRRTLARRLHEDGTSFADLLARVRIAVACRELRETDRQIGDIAHRLGYASQASFATAFRKVVGETPTEFRRRR